MPEADVGSPIREEQQQPTEQLHESQDDDEDLGFSIPWMKSIISISQSFNLQCTHQYFCHNACPRRQKRAARRLMEALRLMYGEKVEYIEDMFLNDETEEHRDSSKKGRWSKWSDSTSTSPDHRKNLQNGIPQGASKEKVATNNNDGDTSQQMNNNVETKDIADEYKNDGFLKYLQLKVNKKWKKHI